MRPLGGVIHSNLFTFTVFGWKVSCTQEFYFHATAVNSVSGSRQETERKKEREREMREEMKNQRKKRKRKKRRRRNCVSHLNARLEIIPLGHFLVLRRGNFSPSAQLLLGVVQVKDHHGVQPALEHQARQVLNVVLPAGKSTQILVMPTARGSPFHVYLDQVVLVLLRVAPVPVRGQFPPGASHARFEIVHV